MAKNTGSFARGIQRSFQNFGGDLGDMLNPILAFQRHLDRSIPEPTATEVVLDDKAGVTDTKALHSYSEPTLPSGRAFLNDLLWFPRGLAKVVLGVLLTPSAFVGALRNDGIASAVASLPEFIGESIGFIIRGMIQAVLAPIAFVFALTTRPIASLVYAVREYPFTLARFKKNPKLGHDLDTLMKLATTPDREREIVKVILFSKEPTPSFYRESIQKACDHGRMDLALSLLKSQQLSQRGRGVDDTTYRIVAEAGLSLHEQQRMSEAVKVRFAEMMSLYAHVIPACAPHQGFGETFDPDEFMRVVSALVNAEFVTQGDYIWCQRDMKKFEQSRQAPASVVAEKPAETASSDRGKKQPKTLKSDVEAMAREQEKRHRKLENAAVKDGKQPQDDPSQTSTGPSRRT